MIKSLTKVGNSRAVILPAQMIAKFKFGRTVMIEETEEGILIRAVRKETNYQKMLKKARENKEEIYRQIEKAANSPEAKAFYSNPENNFSDADPDLKEDY